MLRYTMLYYVLYMYDVALFDEWRLKRDFIPNDFQQLQSSLLWAPTSDRGNFLRSVRAAGWLGLTNSGFVLAPCDIKRSRSIPRIR